ncbi:MAG: PilZ domain-containing protein [Deltaproteobacteria bacterium]|nr:PilZ domain-containing protein [Deltaproteobacteria bacterium]MBW2151867.1 PilZ domain-containing protein [Deltaproteobacteria bacterium]
MDNVRTLPLPAENISKECSSKQGKEVKKKHFVNKLNYINFQNGTIFINFEHRKYKRTLTLAARPLPCSGEILDCVWEDTHGIVDKLKAHSFLNIHIPDRQKLLIVQPHVERITHRGIQFRLPETCFELRSRKVIRYLCNTIDARLIQNSVVFSGKLIDFNANSFKLELKAMPFQPFRWINPLLPVNVIITEADEMLYSGECKILRQSTGQNNRMVVLKPLNHHIQRFKPKKYRSFRYYLKPQLDMIFKHPFTKKSIVLKVVSISGTGFSVEENADSATLLPGLIIPVLDLSFANSFNIRCKAQVIHRKDNEDNNQVICGLAILDMDFENHSKLLSLLNQAKDKYSYFCNTVDMDALWRFFFVSGFIYPEKYAFIHTNKEKIKSKYEKLYTQHPTIARHFIYQVGGRILGHMSMIRFYENSWMGHHHAADRSVSIRAGIDVLSQMNHFLNDAHNVFSAHIDRIFCYFRPENRFPNRVLGGAARVIKDPQKCSLDTFAYSHFHKQFNNLLDMQDPWELKSANLDDLIELESYYEQISDGLMLKALGIEPGYQKNNEVMLEYRRNGFKLEKKIFSLKKDGMLKAVALVSISDIGINLSDLINCIFIIIIDRDDFPREVLNQMLSLLSFHYEQDKIPVLIFTSTSTHTESQQIPCEKLYTLWVLDLNYLDSYLKFIDRVLRSI